MLSSIEIPLLIKLLIVSSVSAAKGSTAVVLHQMQIIPARKPHFYFLFLIRSIKKKLLQRPQDLKNAQVVNAHSVPPQAHTFSEGLHGEEG